MIGMKNFENNFRRLYPGLSEDVYKMIEDYFDDVISLELLENTIKSLQAIGKIDSNTARSMLRDLREFNSQKEVEEMQKQGKPKYDRDVPAGYAERSLPRTGEFMLSPDIMNQLIAIASEILYKNKDAAPDKILDGLAGHRQVKEWLKRGIINDGDLRDALNSASA